MADDLGAYQNPATIFRLLQTARRIAVVGMSANALRASNYVAFYLRRHGYEVIAINPREREIFGEPCYPSLAEAPPPIDIVNVFRVSSAVPEIAEQAIAVGAKALWLQFGVIHHPAAANATARGMDVVMDRCIKVEHARHFGRMHWLGLNTGQISARRKT
jgi:predicted CoA-binding protein